MGPLLLLLLGGAAQSEQDPCCDYQKVSGQGQLDGDYTLESSPTLSTEEACMDSCIYKKLQDSNGEYCFKSSSDPGDVTTCTALPTDAPVTGSTPPPSEQNLNNEKRDLEQDLVNDENDLVKIQEEENDAAAVDSELDKAQTTIDALTGSGEATTPSGRVKRQAAQNCQEIATLVDDIQNEKETKKKLKIIQRITTTTITECTEDDKKILIQKKEVIRIVKIAVQDEIVRIKEKKILIKIKIFTKKKKIKNILAKIEAILATTQKPELKPGAGPPVTVLTEAGPPPPTGESPTGGAPPPTGEQLQQVSTDEPPPTEEQPKPMQTEEPPIPTGEQPKPMPTGGMPPTGEQPYAMTTEEPGVQPKPMPTEGPPPTGEQPTGPNNEAPPPGYEASKPPSTNAPPPLVSHETGAYGTEPAPPPPAI